MSKISEKIYNLRKTRGLSQEELGFEIKVSRQTVSKWEMGTAEPDFKNLVALSEFFNVDVNYFVSSEEAVALNGNKAGEATNVISSDKPKRFVAIKIVLAITVVLTFFVICLMGVLIRSIVLSFDDSLESVYFTFYSLSTVDLLIIVIVSFLVLVCLIVIFSVYLHKRKKKLKIKK